MSDKEEDIQMIDFSQEKKVKKTKKTKTKESKTGKLREHHND
jgi:hypothetical protein